MPKLFCAFDSAPRSWPDTPPAHCWASAGFSLVGAVASIKVYMMQAVLSDVHRELLRFHADYRLQLNTLIT